MLTGRLINNIYFPSLEAGKSKVKVLVELRVWETFLGEDGTGQEEVGRCRAGHLQDRTTEVHWGPPRWDWAGFPCHCRVTCGIGRSLPEALKPLGVASTLS